MLFSIFCCNKLKDIKDIKDNLLLNNILYTCLVTEENSTNLIKTFPELT